MLRDLPWGALRAGSGGWMASVTGLSADVVVIGSGMGGGTTALALARRGVDVLVLERGQRLPREPDNWSPRAVFIERRGYGMRTRSCGWSGRSCEKRRSSSRGRT